MDDHWTERREMRTAVSHDLRTDIGREIVCEQAKKNRNKKSYARYMTIRSSWYRAAVAR